MERSKSVRSLVAVTAIRYRRDGAPIDGGVFRFSHAPQAASWQAGSGAIFNLNWVQHQIAHSKRLRPGIEEYKCHLEQWVLV